MIEEPGCIGGLISFKPQRGPLDNKRRSLQILDSFTAKRFRADEYMTDEPASGVASIRLEANTNSSPLMIRKFLIHFEEYSGSELIPVPIAVAPIFTSRNNLAIWFSRSTSSSRFAAKASNSCPIVIGTASCNWVRPIFSTSLNSSPLARNAWINSFRSATSSSFIKMKANLKEVG